MIFFSTDAPLICLPLTKLKIRLVYASGSKIWGENKKQVEKTLIKLKKSPFMMSTYSFSSKVYIYYKNKYALKSYSCH